MRGEEVLEIGFILTIITYIRTRLVSNITVTNMITPSHCDLAFMSAKYHFDDELANVLRALFNVDQASLRLLRMMMPNTKLETLKRSLLILVKYQLVDYTKAVDKSFNQQYEYSVAPSRVFSFFRVQKFVQKVESKHGTIQGILVKALVGRGVLNRDELLTVVGHDMINHKLENSIEITRDLMTNHLDSLISRRIVVSSGSNLCVNIEKLSRLYRDELVTETVYSLFNRNSKVRSIAETILELSRDNTPDDASQSTPVTMLDLYSSLVPDIFPTPVQLERYMTRLVEETGIRIFETSGIHPQKGPMFSINIGSIIDHLIKEHVSARITTRFGPQCCRIFKVLLKRGPLLLKQVEEMVMLPARDVREYSYMLIKEGLIRNRQVPKTPDNAPGKSVFIMSVELDQVVYNIADLCCRSISNLLRRVLHESDKDKTLLEQVIEAQRIIDSEESKLGLTHEHKSDLWGQYFNSHELVQLETIRFKLDKMLLAKCQVDDTLFLAHTWLCLRPSLVKSID